MAKTNAKTNKDEILTYSKEQSFKKLTELQKLALQRKRVVFQNDEEIELDNPDISSAIKIEKLKGELIGLYKDDDKNASTITVMGDVKLADGTILDLKVGKEIGEED